MVIAFEDVGIGGLDVVMTTVAAAGDSVWRKNHGGDLRLAAYLAGLLTEAAKGSIGRLSLRCQRSSHAR
jgi:hypothetical protein